MRSLGKTLLVGTTLGTAWVLAVAGVLLYVLVRARLMDEFDRSLLDKARLLASTVEREDGRLDLEFRHLDMGEFQGVAPAGYLQLWGPDGSTQYRAGSGAGAELHRPARPSGDPEYVELTLPDGRPGRAVSLAFVPRQGGLGGGGAAAAGGAADREGRAVPGALTLTLARDVTSIRRTLFLLETLLLLVGGGAMVISAAVLGWVVRRALRPVNRLAAEIGRLDVEDLSQRIGGERVPAEMRPVVDRLNDLLDRLDAVLRRERSFSANVAHELRTPLAGLRLQMDVATSRPREPAEYEEAIRACQRIAGQMEAMVENLLCLARLEAGRIQLRSRPIPLAELAGECWRPLAAAAEARRLRVQWAGDATIPLVSDPAQLAVALRNVLENAVLHADPGGQVRVRIDCTEAGAEVEVANTGSPLAPDQAPRALEPFWRGDAARTDAALHAGLGLPLAEKITRLLGGRLTVRSEAGGRFEVTIRVPHDHGRQPEP